MNNPRISFGGSPLLGTIHADLIEQGIGFENSTYLYIVYGVDEDWEVVRFTRDLITETTTGVQTGTKPTSLAEVEGLTYN